MKKILFRSIASFTGLLIAFNLGVGTFITSTIAKSFNLLNRLISGSAKFFLHAIDKKQYEYDSALANQKDELGELDLMIAAHKVKEDAMRRRMWTMMHTIAINKIGSGLHTDYDWEVPRVHQYLRDIVESIPGMVYCNGDDYTAD
jgi:hypothetical protein